MPRRHDLDALRVIAFSLLILYHVAMAYVAQWDFHLKSSWTFDWLQWPMIALNRWRMPLLFVISGIALGLAVPNKQRWRFAWRRSWRLLLPLLFGIVAVVSVQAYCEAVDKGDIAPGLVTFLLRYWQFAPWPDASFTGARYGFTWNHLWYLPYLVVYSLFVMALAGLLRPLRNTLPARPLGSRTLAMLALLPPAWLAWTVLYLLPRYPITHALVDDLYVHAVSLPLFALGYFLARWQRGWQWVEQVRWHSLGIAVLAISVELGIRALGRLPGLEEVPEWLLGLPWAQTERIARAIYIWSALLAIFGWARAWLDRPFAWLPYASSAVFCWYILHQTVLIVLLHWLRPLQLGAWQEPLLVLVGTIVGCALLYEGIRRIAWLQPLFGVRSHPHYAVTTTPRSSTGAGPRP